MTTSTIYYVDVVRITRTGGCFLSMELGKNGE
jgi:hypothetical protein